MDSQRLAEIEARCEAATEGPWEVAWKTDFIWQLDGDGDRFGPIAEAHYAEGNHHNNATFIAHARDDVPDLLAEVRRLTAENEAGKRERRHARHPQAVHAADRAAWMQCVGVGQGRCQRPAETHTNARGRPHTKRRVGWRSFGRGGEVGR
jgi:hypothetical protein